MQLDYPQVLSRLVLLIGAGMSVRSSFFRIGEDYRKERAEGRGRRFIYEEILLMCHEMESGVSELESYSHFAGRCRNHSYSRFCSLLSQNLRKGNAALLSVLQQEAAEAFEERKNLARQMGEEAGTKLLFPMILMLTITMIMIMIPAYTAGVLFRSIVRKKGTEQDPEKSVMPAIEYPRTKKENYIYPADPEQVSNVFSENAAAYSCGRDNEQQGQGACPKTFLEAPGSIFAEENGSDVSGEKSAADEIAGKLYGTSRLSRKYRIDLNRLPCTVGKAPGFADLIIPEPSISGIHAKFFGKISEGSVTVQDLNSNGGTYVNGLRLMPNEAADIWPGDEVRLGDLCFCYR